MKKFIHIVITILFRLILIVSAIYIVLGFFGYKCYVVPTGSMEPNIHVGSLIVVNNKIGYYEIEEGDVIVYLRDLDNKLIVHRAINITEHGIETKGDANPVSDGISTVPTNFIGKEVFAIPYIGNILSAISEPKQKAMVIAGLILMLFVDLYVDRDNEKKETKEARF